MSVPSLDGLLTRTETLQLINIIDEDGLCATAVELSLHDAALRALAIWLCERYMQTVYCCEKCAAGDGYYQHAQAALAKLLET